MFECSVSRFRPQTQLSGNKQTCELHLCIGSTGLLEKCVKISRLQCAALKRPARAHSSVKVGQLLSVVRLHLQNM